MSIALSTSLPRVIRSEPPKSSKNLAKRPDGCYDSRVEDRA
jgi:hypothetical protein